MVNINRVIVNLCAALIIAAIAAFGIVGSPVIAQAGSTGPTQQDCFSAHFHAASDCDRLALTSATVPITGASLNSPTVKDCFSTRYHAASDCDRLASNSSALTTQDSTR